MLVDINDNPSSTNMRDKNTFVVFSIMYKVFLKPISLKQEQSAWNQ